MMKKTSLLVFAHLVFFALVIYFLRAYCFKNNNLESISQPQAQSEAQYRFLSPYAKNDNTAVASIEKFKNSIKPILENKNLEISFYFRDLNNGPWFTLNGQSKFDGASLLKLPILITYYKAAESNPSLLNSEVSYDTNSREYDPDFNQTLKLGQTYKIEQLLEYMIINSDNVSLDLLINYAEEKNIKPSLEQTIEYLGFVQKDGLITTSQYASLLRILYNSEYLNPNMSEQALALMAKSSYQDGLTKYLPEEVIVAHKYGVRRFLQSEERQLHDCGIVYKVNHPYIFCVMTRGKELDEQAEIIAKLSEKAYQLLGNEEK